MQPNTHLAIDQRLCGRVRDVGEGRSVVELTLVDEMRADASGLVHGGFVFGAADYAAMVAVNDPNVVLGSAQVRFTRPSRVGETLRFDARVDAAEGRKRTVGVIGRAADGAEVFVGTFICFVLATHVLHATR
ncbi:MAG TPA: hotdog domain-containing protein [Burkholderiaceae bacterium]|nr:hotdog domain-containing protein [Burkholderiaceae bacterium]